MSDAESQAADRRRPPQMAKAIAALSAIGLAMLTLATPIRADEPRRIASIGGAVTEILYRLGVEERIVAVDSTSLHPSDATRKPNVGYIRALSAEGVLWLSPDLVIMEESAGPPEAVALIDQSGIPVVHVPTGFATDALTRKIREVATAVGKSSEGEAVASQLEGDLDRLATDLKAVKRKVRVLFVLSLVDGRPMAAGADTAANRIVELANAENVFAQVQGYKTISPEAAAALNPDVVLMVENAGPNHAGTDVLALPAFAATNAGKTGALIKMDALYLLGFGPRTAQAARDLAARLYPELKLTENR